MDHRRCPNLVTNAYSRLLELRKVYPVSAFALRLSLPVFLTRTSSGLRGELIIKGRGPWPSPPDNRAKLVSCALADKSVVAQERLCDLLGRYAVHVDLQVQ